jgi:hypothetical protein
MAALYGGDETPAEDGQFKRRIPEGAKVGFVTFDKDIHFYNMNVSTSTRTLESNFDNCLART